MEIYEFTASDGTKRRVKVTDPTPTELEFLKLNGAVKIDVSSIRAERDDSRPADIATQERLPIAPGDELERFADLFDSAAGDIEVQRNRLLGKLNRDAAFAEQADQIRRQKRELQRNSTEQAGFFQLLNGGFTGGTQQFIERTQARDFGLDTQLLDLEASRRRANSSDQIESLNQKAAQSKDEVLLEIFRELRNGY